MKLRRSLAAAAATAVLGPVALLTVTPAYATTPAPSSSVTEAPTTAPDDSAPTATTTPGGPSETPTTTPSESPSESPSPTESVTGEPVEPTPAPTATTVSPTAPGEDDSAVDKCEDFKEGAPIDTVVTGLPSKIVAGSGWKNFSLRVTNKSDKTMDEVHPQVFLDTFGGKDSEPINDLVSLQWSNVGTGDWQDLADELGYFGFTELEAGEYVDVDLRLKVDATAPVGFGFAVVAGDYYDHSGECGFSEYVGYEFQVLAAGEKQGDVDEAKPGKNTKDRDKKDVKPQGGTKKLPVTGTLAETGSSSPLPAISLAGGAAVALGIGAVYIVRRRKAGADA